MEVVRCQCGLKEWTNFGWAVMDRLWFVRCELVRPKVSVWNCLGRLLFGLLVE